MARSRQDEVNKKINISNVGIYCQQLEEQHDLYGIGALTEVQSSFSLGLAHPRDDYLINPFCVTVSVLVSHLFFVHIFVNDGIMRPHCLVKRLSNVLWSPSDLPIFFTEC